MSTEAIIGCAGLAGSVIAAVAWLAAKYGSMDERLTSLTERHGELAREVRTGKRGKDGGD